MQRSTESTVTFRHPFVVSPLHRPLPAGTYRLTVDEDEIAGLSFIAYQRTATLLHIPAIGTSMNTEQYVQIDHLELDVALLKDSASAVSA